MDVVCPKSASAPPGTLRTKNGAHDSRGDCFWRKLKDWTAPIPERLCICLYGRDTRCPTAGQGADTTNDLLEFLPPDRGSNANFRLIGDREDADLLDFLVIAFVPHLRLAKLL